DMVEESRDAGVDEAPVVEVEQPPRKGEKYVDNPEWLAEEIAAEKTAREALARNNAPTEPDQSGYVPGYRDRLGIGLSPLAPQLGAIAPASITPSPGAEDPSGGYKFAFHGYLQAGLRAGIGSRPEAVDGQKTTTLHGDPLVPGAAYGWFEHTMTVPTPWAQLNFEFGNEVLRTTAILGAWSLGQADEASGYFQGPAQLGFNSAFVTFTPKTSPVGLKIDAGVFAERYGAMGEFDSGAYGVSLIAAIYGMGATATVVFPFDNDVTISTEAGFKGDLNTPPVGLVADQSNEMARPIEGSTYAAHGHLSFDFDHRLEVAGHA